MHSVTVPLFEVTHFFASNPILVKKEEFTMQLKNSSWAVLALIAKRIADSTTKIKRTNAIHKCWMDTNKEVNFMTSENSQKAFDADKAEAFSEKLLTALN